MFAGLIKVLHRSKNMTYVIMSVNSSVGFSPTLLIRILCEGILFTIIEKAVFIDFFALVFCLLK